MRFNTRRQTVLTAQTVCIKQQHIEDFRIVNRRIEKRLCFSTADGKKVFQLHCAREEREKRKHIDDHLMTWQADSVAYPLFLLLLLLCRHRQVNHAVHCEVKSAHVTRRRGIVNFFSD